jgi:hypothetical protein
MPLQERSSLEESAVKRKTETGGTNMSENVMRPGKTRRDRLTGAWSNHRENRETRRQWNQAYASGAKQGGLKVIPYPVIGH